MEIRLILLILGLCALAQINARPMLEKRGNLLKDYSLEKRALLKDSALEKRSHWKDSALEKRAMLKLRDNLALEKRGFKENGPVEKRSAKIALIEKRAMLKLRSPLEKRSLRKAAAVEKISFLEKRKTREERDTVPAQYHYVASAPQPAKQPVQQYYYYVQNPDGTRTLASAPAAQAPQAQQQYSQGYQEVPYQAPASSGSSGGGLLSLLSKPVSSIGKVVGVVGDLAQGIIDIPFSLSKDLVQVVLPSDSGLGKVATGILDTGATIVKAPVELVKNVGQLPFEIVSGVVSSLDEE